MCCSSYCYHYHRPTMTEYVTFIIGTYSMPLCDLLTTMINYVNNYTHHHYWSQQGSNPAKVQKQKTCTSNALVAAQFLRSCRSELQNNPKTAQKTLTQKHFTKPKQASKCMFLSWNEWWHASILAEFRNSLTAATRNFSPTSRKL